MKKTHNRAALLTAVIALILCFAMLLGTTFAWFTDTEISERNTISSGNLAIELYYATPENYANDTWTPVDAATDIFKGALWEPGYTHLVYFKAVNTGELALKYDFDVTVYQERQGTNVDNVPFNLSSYLKTYALSEAEIASITGRDDCRTAAAEAGAVNFLDFKNQTQNAAVIKEVVLLPETAIDGTTNENDITFAVAIWMPEETGNEANYKVTDEASIPAKYKPNIELGVQLVATQDTYEEDTFDDQYDVNAQYPTI